MVDLPLLKRSLCTGATKAAKTESPGSPQCGAPGVSPSISTAKPVTGKHTLRIAMN